jgi:hypothetical protein
MLIVGEVAALGAAAQQPIPHSTQNHAKPDYRISQKG